MMKLSEAIRLGAMAGPHLRKAILDGKGGSCALGSAMIAVGIDCIDHTLMHSARLAEYFPILGKQVKVLNIVDVEHRVALPKPSIERVRLPYSQHLRSWIEILNDRIELSRQEIADFVEKVEELFDAREGESTPVLTQEELLFKLIPEELRLTKNDLEKLQEVTD